MNRSVSLGLCAVVILSGCNFLKKKDKEQTDNSSGASADYDKGTSNSNDPSTTDDDPPLDKPYKGCKMPRGDIQGEWTITKGCKTKVKNPITLREGATMTIEQGVKVEFDTDTYIWIEYGKLVVSGTDKEPVVFTSSNKSPAPGDYVGLGFREKTTAGTNIDHLQMEYAGSKSNGGVGAIQLESMRTAGRVSITNSKITKSAQFGIVADDNGGFGKFENNTLADNKSGSLNVKAETLGTIGSGNKFGGEVHVKDSQVDESGRWPVIDVAYQIDGNISIGNESKSATITLPEKGLIKIGQGNYFEVAHNGSGALIAKGVTFTSSSPTPAEGDWGTIFLYPKANGTDLEGCTFEFFGNPGNSAKGAITFWDVNAKDASGITIKDNTFRKGKIAAMTSNDGLCAPFDKNNKADGVPLCGKP